jgi:hypothetical protein
MSCDAFCGAKLFSGEDLDWYVKTPTGHEIELLANSPSFKTEAERMRKV